MIKVCDAIMGSGKSSAAITYMNEHPDRKFIYVTPYCDEAKRIRLGCPELHFVEPSDRVPSGKFTKTGHTLQLLQQGRNVATTHQAMKFYTEEIIQIAREKQYTLIIDEDVQILEKVKCHPCDLKLLIDAGHLSFDGRRYTVVNDEYDGTALAYIFRLMKSRELTVGPTCDDDVDDGEDIQYCDDGDCVIEIEGAKKLLYWALPPTLIAAFSEVIVLTYMFDSSDIHHMLNMNDIPYEHIYVERTADGRFHFTDRFSYMPKIAGNLADYIHIVDHHKLNKIGDDKYALSCAWYNKNPESIELVRRHLHNYFNNLFVDVPCGDRMWSVYKRITPKVKYRGYVKRWTPINMRATNDYRNCTVLAYPVNIFLNVGVKLYYRQFDIELSDDRYALSTMIQWIWRSAIRDGKEINLYLPSSRMRKLLTDWMESVRIQYEEWLASSAEGGEQA